MSEGFLPPVIARLIADSSGYVEGMSRSVSATGEWNAAMEKADLASRKMAASAEASALKASEASQRQAAASQEAVAASEELASVQRQLAAGEISAAEAATRQAAAQERLTAANETVARSSLQAERASIAQSEAQTRAAAAATETAAASRTSAASTTEANTAAATASAGAWSRYSGIVKLAVAGVGYEAIKSATTFQSQTNVYVTAAHETAAGLATVRKGILDIATSTGTSVSQLTQGMYIIEKAGITGAQGLDVLKAAAQGAKEENANLGTVANALTSVMASYKGSISGPVQAMDMMKTLAGESKTSMELLSGSLSNVVPIAANAKISFADVGGLLATMTQHGETADHATQGLASAISHLQNPTHVQIQELNQLGLSSVDLVQKLGDGPGGRGLAGTLKLISDTIIQRMGPSGQVLLSVMNQSQQDATNAATALAQLGGPARDLAQGYKDGSVSLSDYRKGLKGLPADQAALVNQYKTLQDRSNGFNAQLRSGNPLVQSYAQALSKATGGQLDLNTALEVLGPNYQSVIDNTQRLGDAQQKSGKDVEGWSSYQKTLTGQLGDFKGAAQAAGIGLGTFLLPAATEFFRLLNDSLHFIRDHSTAFKDLAIAVAAVAIPMYAITKATQAYYAVMRGVAAVQAVWGGLVGMYQRVATSMGWVTTSSEEMVATQQAVAADVEAAATALGGESTAATEAAAATGELNTQLDLFGSTELAATTETDALTGQMALLSTAEVNAGGAAATAAGEVDGLATAEAAVGGAADTAAPGVEALAGASRAAGGAAGTAAPEVDALATAAGVAGGASARAAGEVDALALAEGNAGRAAAAAAPEVAGLGAAGAGAGAGTGAARTGILGMGVAAGASVLRMAGLFVGISRVVGGIHQMTSGQKAGDQAAKDFNSSLNAQHNNLAATNQAIADGTKKMNELRGPASFGKGLGGMLTGGLLGNNPIKSISEANQLEKSVDANRIAADNMRLAEQALSAEYGINGAQVEALANKYGVNLAGNVNAAVAKFQHAQGTMGNTGAAADALRGHVDNLGNAIQAVPNAKATHVSAPGAQQATDQVNGFHGGLSSLHDVKVVITAVFNAVGNAWDWVKSHAGFSGFSGFSGHAQGGLVGFADGGMIRGPGTGTSDSILGLSAGGTPTAMVSNGEYVVNAAQTAKNLPLLQAINSGQGGGGKGGLDAGYGKLATDTADLTTKSTELTKRFTDQTKALKDQNTTVDDGHAKLGIFTDAITAHHAAVDALIPRVVASTDVHLTDHKTVDGLTGGYHVLTGAIQQTPTAHHTNTDAPGAVNTTGQIRTLESTIRAMQPKTDRINIDTSVSGVFASLFAGGGLVGFAGGGMLRGPGTGTSDSILGIDAFGMPTARVSNGEFVVNAEDTARALPLLQAINAGMFAQGGMIRKLAAGGAVAANVSDPTASDAGRYTPGVAALVNRVDAMLNPKAHTLIEHKAADEVKKKIAAMSAGFGSGVGRWAPLVLAVDKMLGLSPALLGVELSQMATESGGNPGSINLTDSNAAAGHPSQGLMQVIPGTFAAYAGPFARLGILNPLANIYAGLNYAMHRYGPGLSALGHGHGYAKGGLVGGLAGGGIVDGSALFNPWTMGNRRANIPNFWNLTYGSMFNATRDMSALGFGAVNTGDVRRAQSALHVAVDGIIGPQTYGALQSAVARRAHFGGGPPGRGMPPTPQQRWAQFGAAMTTTNNQLNAEGFWNSVASGMLANGQVTKQNASNFDGWVAQTNAEDAKYTKMLNDWTLYATAHPHDVAAQNFEGLLIGYQQRAHAAAVQAQTLEAQARAAVAGPEAPSGETRRPTSIGSSFGSSWDALHAPTPTHANVTTVIKLDSKVLYSEMQTQALRTERRNGSNNLSKTR